MKVWKECSCCYWSGVWGVVFAAGVGVCGEEGVVVYSVLRGHGCGVKVCRVSSCCRCY